MLKITYLILLVFSLNLYSETSVEDKNKSILNCGDMSILSFHATKVFNTFEGGAIISHDKNMKRRIDNLKNFGFDVAFHQIEDVDVGMMAMLDSGAVTPFCAPRAPLRPTVVKQRPTGGANSAATGLSGACQNVPASSTREGEVQPVDDSQQSLLLVLPSSPHFPSFGRHCNYHA